MGKHFQLYIKVFFYFTISLGVGMSILFMILVIPFTSREMLLLQAQSVFSLTWRFSIVGGLLFSASMVSIHIWRVRSLPAHNPENISPFQTRSFVLETDQLSAYKSCTSSLMLISGNIIDQNPPFQIKARTPPSMSGFGEEIVFSLKSIKATKTFVNLTCEPKLKTTLVDFGKSIELIEKIHWYLEDKLQS